MENKRIGRLAPIEEGGKAAPETLAYRRLEVPFHDFPTPFGMNVCAVLHTRLLPATARRRSRFCWEPLSFCIPSACSSRFLRRLSHPHLLSSCHKSKTQLLIPEERAAAAAFRVHRFTSFHCVSMTAGAVRVDSGRAGE